VLMVSHNTDQFHYASRAVKMIDGEIISDSMDKNDFSIPESHEPSTQNNSSGSNDQNKPEAEKPDITIRDNSNTEKKDV
jgi:ABC-type uncharacterized transport system ATPase component